MQKFFGTYTNREGCFVTKKNTSVLYVCEQMHIRLVWTKAEKRHSKQTLWGTKVAKAVLEQKNTRLCEHLMKEGCPLMNIKIIFEERQHIIRNCHERNIRKYHTGRQGSTPLVRLSPEAVFCVILWRRHDALPSKISQLLCRNKNKVAGLCWCPTWYSMLFWNNIWQ